MTDQSHRPVPTGQPREHTPRRFEWWHRLRPLTRRAIRVGAALLAAVLTSVGFAIATASHTGSLGPHVAEYSTRLNGEIRVDMGPIGSLVVSSPLPANLGVYVLVREIPDQLTSDDADPIEGLMADLNSYNQFLANPQATVDDATRGLVQDVVGRTVVTMSVLMMAIALSRLAAHGVLREAARSVWGQPGVPVVAPVLAVVLVVLPLSDLTRTSGLEGRTSPVLSGTPLEEARITGRLATIIDHYGGMVVRAVEDNTRFYADVEANVVAAYEADPEPLAPAPRPVSQEESDAATTDGATDPDTEYATFLMITDLHCNVGMGPVIGTVAQLAEVDAILNAGDTVMSGTSVESFCINAFADALPADVPVIVADGNHDSVLTAEQERARGWTVLDGDVVEVAGVRIIGDTDPTLTEIGTGTRPERDETVVQMGERLRDQVCELQAEGNPADILLVHSPHAGRQSLEAGCVPLNLSGHMHSQGGPWQWGWGVQYISSSTAGATLGRPTVGPLQGTAAMTVIRWNLTEGIPDHYRLIHAQTDTSVTLGPWLNFPALPSQFVDPSAPEPQPDVPQEVEEPVDPDDVDEGDPSAPDQNLPEDDEAIREQDEQDHSDEP